MRWLTVAGVLLYLSRCNAGVLKCSPESPDPSCASEKRDLLMPPSPRDQECLPGSEWESNCHSCRCSDSGTAECLRQDSCALKVVAEPIKCKPFTSFQSDCNSCSCQENGEVFCTLKACLGTDRRKREATAQDSKKCVPGTSWKESCNSCWCTDKGIPACTKKGCLSAISKREAPAQNDENKCEPGTSWKLSCNRCWCTDSGKTACIEKGCIREVKPLKFSFPKQNLQEKCEPGTTWNLKCNFCWCNNNGIAACTMKHCLRTRNRPLVENRDAESVSKYDKNHVIVKRGVCKPNQEFQIDCNPCKCAANGQSYTCSHSECLEGDNTNKEVEVFMENEAPTITKSSNNTKQVVCVANRMFIMDCNTCWCNEDGTSFFCTRRICTPDSTENIDTEDPEVEAKLRVVKKECRPNEVFELDCNMCRCNAEGTSFSCTRRACVDFDDKNATLSRKSRAVQEAPKTCQPGTEFRMDCNKCLCNDEGQDFSCTRMDCAALNGNGADSRRRRSFSGRSKRHTNTQQSETVALECVAGSVFNRECNVCRCTAEGQHAVCTTKRCKQESVEPDTEPTPSFRCTPGDQFKRDCKDCTCSADGKNVFCTLRLCDQVLADMEAGQSVV